MYGIFVINSAGETIAEMGWENLEGDSALLGGFVSALQMFIKRISGNEVNELQFGDMKLLIGAAGDNYVVTLHSNDEKDAKSQNQEVVRLLNEHTSEDIDDGILGLISAMISDDRSSQGGERVRRSVREWTKKETDKAREAARDWGKTVF